MFEQVTDQGKTIAIIVRADFRTDGIKFFTDSSYSQQLAQMDHAKGHVIKPHVHNPVSRSVQYTQEALFLKKGKLRVDLYSQERNFICSKVLSSGDVILLCSGGHGFEVLEDIQMVEVKQGPYAGDQDKTVFDVKAPS
jgi:hypothetical protein